MANFAICFGLCLLLFVSFLSHSSQDLKGLHENIPIGELDGVKLSINIAFPATLSKQARPVLMMIHGGGFLKGNKNNNNARIQKLSKRGFVAASVMYRFAPQHKFPAALDDVKLAIRFLKAHAKKYHINPERIIISGSSSGGFLAVMAGVTGNSDAFSKHGLYTEFNSSVHAIAAQSAPIADYRQAKYSDYLLVDRLLAKNADNQQQRLAAMSAVTYLDTNDPPMFLTHGDIDPIVPVHMTREFVSELQKANHIHQYIEIKGATHSFNQSTPEKARTVFTSYVNFIEKWAKTDRHKSQRF
ncbi:MAG: alpha/beta hydrolase [Paraglaciecola sp.]|uniref:alpha/beta hydrolase n=1 Tax=Paraglaciecola sp. TaxID=1920173 RepID=UPI003298E2DA